MPCASGTTNAAEDDADGPDTSCDAIICDETGCHFGKWVFDQNLPFFYQILTVLGRKQGIVDQNFAFFDQNAVNFWSQTRIYLQNSTFFDQKTSNCDQNSFAKVTPRYVVRVACGGWMSSAAGKSACDLLQCLGGCLDAGNFLVIFWLNFDQKIDFTMQIGLNSLDRELKSTICWSKNRSKSKFPTENRQLFDQNLIKK